MPFTVINQLTEEDAQLLIAIEIEGISQKKFAGINYVNYFTLKSRVDISRNKLYRLFNSCCVFALDTQGNIVEYNSISGDYGGVEVSLFDADKSYIN